MNYIPLLLSNPSANLRLLVLKELLGNINQDEIDELEAVKTDDKLIKDLVGIQNADGSWSAINPLLSQVSNKIAATSLALTRLGYFGFDRNYPPVEKGVEYLFSLQKKDGSWPFKKTDDETSGYTMVPLQTSIPLQGISSCGYAEDKRSVRAYEWLLHQRLEDGAWPTGIASGVFGYVAGYRRIAHSRWGCRSNTTSALVCLSRHPELKKSSEAGRALDLLLGRNTSESYCLGYEIARMLGFEPVRGFFTFYARYDLALMLDLCAKTGLSGEDERVAALIDSVVQMKGKYGIWNYQAHNGASGNGASGWITFDILRSLSGLKKDGDNLSHGNLLDDYLSHEPVTPFKAYYKKPKRY